MKRLAAVSALVVVLVFTLVVPAFAVPANNGLGRMFGEHTSTEAKAGTLGRDVHRGQHLGFHGWPMATGS